MINNCSIIYLFIYLSIQKYNGGLSISRWWIPQKYTAQTLTRLHATTHIFHLFFEAGVDFIAFGQRLLELVELLSVEGQLWTERQSVNQVVVKSGCQRTSWIFTALICFLKLKHMFYSESWVRLTVNKATVTLCLSFSISCHGTFYSTILIWCF